MMVTIATPIGNALVNDETITRIVGRTPVYPYTVVWGPGAGSIETPEPPASLSSRLVLKHPLAILHSPNGDPVWIKSEAVSVVRTATPFEHGTDPPFINTMIIVGGRSQALMEDQGTAAQVLAAAGARFPMAAQNFEVFDAEVTGLRLDHQASSDSYSPW